jgi:pimeloyl-ACP methyl ester carboxylesterase
LSGRLTDLGRRWLLLRGLSRAQGHWGDFLADLRAALPGDRFETADLPGCGERRALVAPSDVGGTVDLVREAAGSDRRWLLGLSMGGMVAYEWARRHPDEIAGLVLISSSLGGVSPPWQRLRPGAVWQVLRCLVTGDPERRERRIFALTSARPALEAAAVKSWAELARTQPARRRNVLRQLLVAARYRPRGTPSVPLLLLAGRRDRLVDPAASRAIADVVPAATIEEHPDAGHDLPLDDPGWVADRVASWVTDLAAVHSRGSEAGRKAGQ